MADIYYTFVDEWDIESLQEQLPAEEINPLRSIVHQPTFNQKIVNRALLRYLLKQVYAIPEEYLSFEYNDRGKPFLKNNLLHFNTSHSHNMVLIGISTSAPIGVDIEYIKNLHDEEGIAQTFFSIDEFASYRKLRNEDPLAFYKFWTAKEALIKALGKGLWEASLVPELIWHEGNLLLKENNDWSISLINPIPHYCAGIVTRGDTLKKVVLLKGSYTVSK